MGFRYTFETISVYVAGQVMRRRTIPKEESTDGVRTDQNPAQRNTHILRMCRKREQQRWQRNREREIWTTGRLENQEKAAVSGRGRLAPVSGLGGWQWRKCGWEADEGAWGAAGLRPEWWARLGMEKLCHGENFSHGPQPVRSQQF